MGSDSGEVRRYIEGAKYPARSQDLHLAAQSGGVPEDALERLEGLPTNAQFFDLGEVVEELKNLEGPGEPQEPPG